MKSIPLKVWNRIEMLQQPIVAIARASAPGRKRWVAIHYDVSRQSITERPPHRYCVTDTEFDADLLDIHAENQDEDMAIGNQAKHYVADIDALYAVLLSLEVDPESFEAPWHVDYPL